MTGWDWNRIGSLLDNADNVLQCAKRVHQDGTVAEHEGPLLLKYCEDATRDLEVIKALLKRERLRKA